MKQNWSASATFVWNPTFVDSLSHVGVWVRNATTTTDTPEASGQLHFPITGAAPLALANLSANKPAPQPAGTMITFTAATTGGTAPYQYKWLQYSTAGGWEVKQNWSASATFVWNPTFVDSLSHVGVWVRNATTASDTPEASGQMHFPITPP